MLLLLARIFVFYNILKWQISVLGLCNFLWDERLCLYETSIRTRHICESKTLWCKRQSDILEEAATFSQGSCWDNCINTDVRTEACCSTHAVASPQIYIYPCNLFPIWLRSMLHHGWPFTVVGKQLVPVIGAQPTARRVPTENNNSERACCIYTALSVSPISITLSYFTYFSI